MHCDRPVNNSWMNLSLANSPINFLVHTRTTTSPNNNEFRQAQSFRAAIIHKPTSFGHWLRAARDNNYRKHHRLSDCSETRCSFLDVAVQVLQSLLRDRSRHVQQAWLRVVSMRLGHWQRAVPMPIVPRLVDDLESGGVDADEVAMQVLLLGAAVPPDKGCDHGQAHASFGGEGRIACCALQFPHRGSRHGLTTHLAP